jgi:hypothetical protein
VAAVTAQGGRSGLAQGREGGVVLADRELHQGGDRGIAQPAGQVAGPGPPEEDRQRGGRATGGDQARAVAGVLQPAVQDPVVEGRGVDGQGVGAQLGQEPRRDQALQALELKPDLIVVDQEVGELGLEQPQERDHQDPELVLGQAGQDREVRGGQAQGPGGGEPHRGQAIAVGDRALPITSDSGLVGSATMA